MLNHQIINKLKDAYKPNINPLFLVIVLSIVLLHITYLGSCSIQLLSPFLNKTYILKTKMLNLLIVETNFFVESPLPETS